MSDDDLLLDDWRTNYGLHDKSPGEAAQWWHDNLGYVPVGAVAALGTAIEMIEKLRAALAAAQKDAERYRWIADNCMILNPINEIIETEGDLDAAIAVDAELVKEQR